RQPAGRRAAPVVEHAAAAGGHTLLEEDRRGRGGVGRSSDLHSFAFQRCADVVAERIIAQPADPARTVAQAGQRYAEVALRAPTRSLVVACQLQAAAVCGPEEHHCLAQGHHLYRNRLSGWERFLSFSDLALSQDQASPSPIVEAGPT